jgi:hypothetical protein
VWESEVEHGARASLDKARRLPVAMTWRRGAGQVLRCGGWNARNSGKTLRWHLGTRIDTVASGAIDLFTIIRPLALR